MNEGRGNITVDYVVPVWNASEYLEACVESILSQQIGDVHIILVDDGSTDGSGELCDKLSADHPCITVVHQKNAGPSAARNAAIPHLRGEFVVFVDADDKLLPDFSRTLFAMMHDSVDIAAGGFEIGTTPRKTTPKHGGVKYLSPKQAVECSLYQHTINNSCSGKLYRREIVERTLFTEGTLYEDLEIFHRYALEARKIAVTQDKVYFYRMNPKSLLHTFNARRLDVLRVTEGIERRYSEDAVLAKAARDRRFAANFNMLLLCAATDREGYAATIDACWEVIRKMRREVLTNRRARMKNRLGALLSFTGRRCTLSVAGATPLR